MVSGSVYRERGISYLLRLLLSIILKTGCLGVPLRFSWIVLTYIGKAGLREPQDKVRGTLPVVEKKTIAF